ncbi:hypothetical protein L1049_009316 [Liquidambar formosana]|uniref:Ricin B-like lectin R40G3 n=1 Tax=Liquidambar formosana TaxID=63359 RepID=A0AAP0X2U1_LIQFO
MEFPFGHHTRRHNRRDEGNEEEEEYPQPPPPYYGDDEAPPQVTHVYHTSPVPPPASYPFPPPDDFNYSAFPQPPPPQPAYSSTSTVHHVSHEEIRPDAPIESETQQHQHHFTPHLPSILHHHTHSNQVGSDLSNKPTFRVFCKAETGHSLTIRDGKVILAPSDQSDDLQHWYKDEKYSTRVKDEEGFPGFALVNKATGQAMKHSIGETQPVELIPYNSDVLDVSILWTLSKDLGDGFRTIRMVNNLRLNVDAFQGDKKHGGVHDGTTIVLWDWNKGDNQRWKMIPY